MPVISSVFSRIWKFVDHRSPGDEVTRLDLDTALDDFVPAINGALAIVGDATTQAGIATAAAAAAIVAKIEWQGPWATATSYAVSDAVERNGTSYICTSAHTSGATTDPGTGGSWTTVWDLLAQKGTDGAGSGDMLAANNLSELANKPAALTNLGFSTDSKAVVTAANKAAMRTAMGVAIGSDVQAYNTNLGRVSSATPEIWGSDFHVKNAAGTETIIEALENGSVYLFYNNNYTAWTISTGWHVTGAVEADTIAGNWVATQAEAEAGTDDTQVMTPLKTQQAIAKLSTITSTITKSYTSTAQTITTSGALTLAHGLGVAPKLLTAKLVATSVNNGYSTGDVLEMGVGGRLDSTGRGMSVVSDATNIYIRFGDQTQVFGILNKSTGAGVVTINTSWNLVMGAFA